MYKICAIILYKKISHVCLTNCYIWKNFLQNDKEVILRIYWLNSFIIITNANKINVKKKNIYNMRNMYKNPQSVQYQ